MKIPVTPGAGRLGSLPVRPDSGPQGCGDAPAVAVSGAPHRCHRTRWQDEQPQHREQLEAAS
ncbi:hypothetical protein AAHZ94_30350 [Streptomyces sp. HSW2009]|uniref:hypothetical protein n=1 Tax=Streptomyces sp. HSW2009 TaxID=3142890 RepID=UPI0032EEE147